MKKTKIDIRFSEKEKVKIAQMSNYVGMSMSDYIKSKIFEQNIDLLEEGTKYICPNSFKQAYFLAFSQIKIQHLLEEILIRQKDMDLGKYKKFDKENYQKINAVLASLGYQKIEK